MSSLCLSSSAASNLIGQHGGTFIAGLFFKFGAYHIRGYGLGICTSKVVVIFPQIAVSCMECLQDKGTRLLHTYTLLWQSLDQLLLHNSSIPAIMVYMCLIYDISSITELNPLTSRWFPHLPVVTYQKIGKALVCPDRVVDVVVAWCGLVKA